MWQWLMTDVTTVAKDVLELSQSRPEKQVYMSLPRPGVRKQLPRHKQSQHILCIQIAFSKENILELLSSSQMRVKNRRVASVYADAIFMCLLIQKYIRAYKIHIHGHMHDE